MSEGQTKKSESINDDRLSDTQFRTKIVNLELI